MAMGSNIQFEQRVNHEYGSRSWGEGDRHAYGEAVTRVKVVCGKNTSYRCRAGVSVRGGWKLRDHRGEAVCTQDCNVT